MLRTERTLSDVSEVYARMQRARTEEAAAGSAHGGLPGPFPGSDPDAGPPPLAELAPAELDDPAIEAVFEALAREATMRQQVGEVVEGIVGAVTQSAAAVEREAAVHAA